MLIKLILPFFLLIFSITVLLAIILYSWLYGRSSGPLKSYLSLLVILIIWLLSKVLMFFSTNAQLEEWIKAIHLLAICYMGFSWFIFCLHYSENQFLKNPPKIILMGIIPAIFFVSIMATHSYKEDFLFIKPNYLSKISFWFLLIGTYLFFIYGMIYFIKYSLKQFGEKKKQIFILCLMSFLLLFYNIIQIDIDVQLGLEYTPLVFSFALLFFSISFKELLIDTKSLAMEKIMDNMKEAVLFIGSFNQIIDFNPAFIEAFKEYGAIKIGDPIHVFTDNLEEAVEKNSESIRILLAITKQERIPIYGPINLIKPMKKCFVVNIWPVLHGRDLIGRVLSFKDISLAKNLWDELYTTNNQLLIKNQQLNHYAEIVAELAVAKERNRFARDVHDTLGQTMTLLVTVLQIAKLSFRTNPEKSENQMDKALKIAEEGLAEVKRSLLNMPDPNNSLKKALESLAEDFQMSGMEIELSIGELGLYDDFSPTSVVYRICQEALTNALRHGKANRVWITIELDNQWLYLAISDDGRGCREFRKGFGLHGMEERVNHLKGNIIYNPGMSAGFSIFVMIPLSS
jgi:signal transduction histidine kinase